MMTRSLFTDGAKRRRGRRPAAERTWLGVPVLAKVAESLRAMMPAFPTPVARIAAGAIEDHAVHGGGEAGVRGPRRRGGATALGVGVDDLAGGFEDRFGRLGHGRGDILAERFAYLRM